MKEEVQSFLSRITEREHVLQLIKRTEFSLTFKNGLENISLAFQNGEIFFGSLQPNYDISGDIQILLEGREPLRVLLHRGQINLSAPFRIILLLESFFYLAKGNLNVQKII